MRVSAKLGAEVEVATPEVTTGLGSAVVLGNYGACKPFRILYRNEEISLKDVVLFRWVNVSSMKPNCVRCKLNSVRLSYVWIMYVNKIENC